MDKNNVLDYTHDLEQLELDYSQWQMLTYDLKKISDMYCMQQYGMYNTQLYEKLRAEIISNNPVSDELVTEAFFIDDTYNSNYNILQNAYVLQRNDPLITIITPYDSNQVLDDKLAKYNQSTEKYKNISDNYSIELYGSPIIDMYNKFRKTEISSIQPTLEDVAMYRYENEVKEACYNPLRYRDLVLECMVGTFKRSNYEKVQMQNILDSNPVRNTIEFNRLLPDVVPFMTINEYSNYNDTSKLSLFSYVNIEDGKKYIDTIRQLQENKQTESLLKLGWNPNIKITPESIKYARDKQVRFFNKNYNLQLVDLSNYTTSIEEAVSFDNLYDPAMTDGKKLHPVFITMVYNKSLHGEIIKSFTKSNYSHVGIALEPSLENIYSYTLKNNLDRDDGFGSDSIRYWLHKDKNSKLAIAVIFVDNETFKKLKRNINWFKNNKDKTKYNLKNIWNILRNKAVDMRDSLSFVCSQFVDIILKMCNIDLIDKSDNLVVPGDYYKLTRNPKIFLLYEGYTKYYRASEMNKKIKALYHRKIYSNEDPTIIDKVQDAIKSIGEHNIDTLNRIICKTDNQEINTIVSEMVSMITPEAIYEQLDPNRFTMASNIYNGYVEVKSKRDTFIDIEKTLQAYNSSMHIDTVKECLGSLWSLRSKIEKDMNKIKDPDRSVYQQLELIKSNCDKLYNSYIKIVKNKDSSFNVLDYVPNNSYNTIDWTPIYKYNGSNID